MNEGRIIAHLGVTSSDYDPHTGTGGTDTLYVVCLDNTIWELDRTLGEWRQLPDVPGLQRHPDEAPQDDTPDAALITQEDIDHSDRGNYPAA